MLSLKCQYYSRAVFITSVYNRVPFTQMSVLISLHSCIRVEDKHLSVSSREPKMCYVTNQRENESYTAALVAAEQVSTSTLFCGIFLEKLTVALRANIFIEFMEHRFQYHDFRTPLFHHSLPSCLFSSGSSNKIWNNFSLHHKCWNNFSLHHKC
jgi:hypothetical protein